MKNYLSRRALLLGAVLILLPALVLAGDTKAPDKPAAPAPAARGEADPPTPAEQVVELEAMCAAHGEAMAARHAETPLFERLGGEEKIHALLVEIVRLHDDNPALAEIMEGIDREKLIHGVSTFLVAATGGPPRYEGRSMHEAHAHLELTNADFMAAGKDVMKAMQNKGYGEAEIQEIVCALVSLRPQVVIESERELPASE